MIQAQRLLQVSTTALVGGVESVVLTVASGLRQRGWAVRSVFPRWGDDAFVQWCLSQGVTPELATIAQPWSGLSPTEKARTVREMARLVKAARPDVVNLHYGGGHISFKDALAVRLAGVRRSIVSVHHPWSWAQAGHSKRVMTLLGASLADGVVVPSRAVARIQRQAGVPSHKIHVIPNGVSPPPPTLSRQEARDRLGIDQDAVIVSSLARLVPDKRIDALIRAMSRLMALDHPRWQLVVGGDGPQRRGLEELARSVLPEDRFVFTGPVEVAADLYAATDIFALPSSQEGFGLVFVEAALCGVPSIGANVGGVPEVILDDQTGLLVPTGDIDALAAATYRLLTRPSDRKRLATAARQRAQAEFSADIMIDKYARVLAAA